MIKQFELTTKQLQIKEVLENKSFIEIEIYAISDAEPNNNMSSFTLKSMKKGVDTFTNKPIVGFFNSDKDFESHNGRQQVDKELGVSYWDNSSGEQILGFIRESDTVEIVERDGQNWIYCTAMIYTNYNYQQVKRLLEDMSKKVSVEVEVTKSETIDGIEYFYEFELLGITILGSKNGVQIKEGIEGAKLSVLEAIGHDNFSAQRQAICFAYEELTKTGSDPNLENSSQEETAFYSLGQNSKVDNNENKLKGDNNSMEEVEKLKAEFEALQVVNSELEAKFTEEEVKCKAAEEKCLEAEEKCSEAEEKYEKLEIKCSELEEKCANFDATVMELEETKAEVKSMKIEKHAEQLKTLSAELKLESEEVAELSTKIEEGSFMSFEEMEKELSYIAYKKGSFAKEPETVDPESVAKKDFAAGLTIPINPATSEPEKTEDTVWARLEENIK